MQKFISPICVNPTETLEKVFNVSSADEKTRHCARLVAEICSEFDLQVYHIRGASRGIASHAVYLTTKDNYLPAGYVWTEGTRSDDMTYFYNNPIIHKEKSSAKSDRSTRDSSKIKTLIANLRKNTEIPLEGLLIKNYEGGIGCAFRAIANTHSGARFDINNSMALAATKVALGIDTQMPNDVRLQLQSTYDKFLEDTKLVKDMRETQKRFAQSSTFIGVIQNDHETNTSYLVGKVSYDIDKNEVTFHEGVKRYSTLVDTPLAPTAVMLRTYLKDQPHRGRNSENELGVTNTDHYYDDIDIAVGYSNYKEIFTLIPDIHE
mgnify:CR=1 FL=1